MEETRTDAQTHVEEWADLVGDEVSERPLRERGLESGWRRDDEGDAWPDGAS